MSDKSVHDKVRDGAYKNTVPYPKPKDPQKIVKRHAYQAEGNRLEALFKADLFAEYNVTGPAADVMYAKAYQMGHSAGWSEIAGYFEDLVEIYDACKRQFGSTK